MRYFNTRGWLRNRPELRAYGISLKLLIFNLWGGIDPLILPHCYATSLRGFEVSRFKSKTRTRVSQLTSEAKYTVTYSNGHSNCIRMVANNISKGQHIKKLYE